MLERRGNMPTTDQKSEYLQHGFAERPISGLLRFAASGLVVAGCLAMTFPSTSATIPSSYRNQYRGCAGRLLSVGIAPEAAASACAETLRPKDLSRCVVEIEQETAIAAVDALSTCRQVRRPNELATCVVGISRNSQDDAIPSVLNYCGRSLLPERFAECVVGLRVEADFAATAAMDTCISAGDQLGNVDPNFIPENQTPLSNPNSAPTDSQNQTPLIQPAPATPDVSPDLTPQVEPLAPTTPDNAGQ